MRGGREDGGRWGNVGRGHDIVMAPAAAGLKVHPPGGPETRLAPHGAES